MTDFFRFPSTTHIAWLANGSPREDKVLSSSEADAFLAVNVSVEEKIDGANVGFSLAPDGTLRAQNRGQYLADPHAGQFARLPDWFLLFDVYERQSGQFWSSARRNALAADCGLATVPTLFRGRQTLAGLTAMLDTAPSRYRSGTLEGVVVRQESELWCHARAKLVRPDFTQTITEHWSRRRLEWNRLDWSATHVG